MKGKIAGSAAALALAVSFIGGWEGSSTKAYKDIVGVWTVCYGETRGVKPTDTYTQAECDAMFGKAIIDYERKFDNVVAKETQIPVATKIAFVSWIYNVGEGNARKSTLVKKVRLGDLKGACDELLKWNKAGGKVVKGLTNRRVDERELCLWGLNN